MILEIFKKAKIGLMYFSLAFVFFIYEILLMVSLNVFSVKRMFLSLSFSLLIGAIINIILIFVKHKKIVASVFVVFFGILYVAEILIYKCFGNFMAPTYAIEQSASVFSEYLDIVLKLISKNIALICLYVLVIVLFVKSVNMKVCLDKTKRFLINIVVVGVYLVFLVSSVFGRDIDTDFDSMVANYGLSQGIFLSTIISNGGGTSFETENDNITVSPVVHETESMTKSYNVLNIDFDAIESEYPTEDIKKINDYVKSREASEKNKYTGIFKGKNIIMICAESFSKYVANKDLTPTLYRLINKGFKFEKYYTPKWGGSTGTGEYAYLTGIIPAAWDSSLFKTVENDMSFNLPSQLKKMGYRTFSYHTGIHTFYHRNVTYPNLGLDNFLARGNGIENYLSNLHSDIEMFEKTIDIYKNQTPFCAYYMTYAGHFPYEDVDAPRKYRKIIDEFYNGKYEGKVRNYLALEMSLENSLSMLLKRLEEENLLDNTVICLTSDHYPYGLDGDNAQEMINLSYLAGVNITSENFQFRDANNLIIWSKEIEDKYDEGSKRISDVVSSVDIEPTLLNLFGIEFDSRLFSGRDVFAKNIKPMVVYNNGSFLINEYNYNKSSGKKGFDDNGNEVAIDENELSEYKKIAKNKIEYADLFIKNDYYRKVLKHIK